MDFQGGHGKFDSKSRGSTSKKIDILNRGGTYFPGEAHFKFVLYFAYIIFSAKLISIFIFLTPPSFPIPHLSPSFLSRSYLFFFSSSPISSPPLKKKFKLNSILSQNTLMIFWIYYFSFPLQLVIPTQFVTIIFSFHNFKTYCESFFRT